MPINYSIVKNNLKPDNPRFRAQFNKSGTLNFNDIIENIARPGTGITRAEAVGVLTRLQEVITDGLKDGYNINLPFANFGIGIKGNFRSKDDVFNGKRHKVVPYTEPGKELLDSFSIVETHKKPYHAKAPSLFGIHDTTSGLHNTCLTPKGIAVINGKNLKFDPTDEKQGIFLTGCNGTIRVSLVASIRQTELLFQVPEELQEGEYQLSVRAVPLHAGEIRSGSFNKVLLIR